MNKLIIFAISILLLSWFWACDPNDDYITDSNAKLAFSLDTLRFDTVFTQIGSATRSFKVYNRNDRTIRISNITLLGSSAVKFRLNVDGLPGNQLTDVDIYPNDSIYVFVEVTVNPNQPLSVSPFIIEDRIVFETNGNIQEVRLEAWGQNANYFPSRFNKGVPVVLTCRGGEVTWNDPKPYVIYGEVFIDSCTLNIPAGTRIYVHGGIVQNEFFGVFNDGIIYILDDGRLKVQGTKEKPVIIQGDRLEPSFLDDPGQWAGIIIGKGSRGNVFEYATIRNNIYGIYADSSSEVTLRNTQIYNTSSSALIGVRSRITAENCLFYNNQANSVSILHGGDYQFTYCTAASYGVNASALSMSNYLCYDDPLLCRNRSQYRLNASFRNCIFFGSAKDQIRLADISGGQTAGLFNVKFEDCIVRVEDLLKESNGLYAKFFDDYCKPCINGKTTDKLFVDANKDNYYLDSLSVAIGKAKPIFVPRIIDIDLDGKPRDATKPDIGCYERQ